MLESSGVQNLLMQILDELRRSNARQKERLWSVDDIACYLSLSRGSVMNRIICRASFPKAIRITTSTGRTNPRWKPSEVKTWVEKFRK